MCNYVSCEHIVREQSGKKCALGLLCRRRLKEECASYQPKEGVKPQCFPLWYRAKLMPPAKPLAQRRPPGRKPVCGLMSCIHNSRRNLTPYCTIGLRRRKKEKCDCYRPKPNALKTNLPWWYKSEG